MKKTKKKIKDPFELCEQNEWCPLFGPLPKIEYYNHLQGLCIDIIEEARLMWGVDGWGAIAYGLKTKNYSPRPRYEDVPDYLALNLSTARIIFDDHESTRQHVLGRFDTLDMKCPLAVELVHDFHDDDQFNPHIQGWCIIAMFALAEAWSVLESLLVYHIPENDPTILLDLLVAMRLLGIAKEEAHWPYLMERRKILEGARKGQAARGQVKEDRWTNWQQAANEIWKKNGKLSKRRVAILMLEKFQESDETHLIAGVVTISKRIKKPHL
jgi:hypothetical protein